MFLTESGGKKSSGQMLVTGKISSASILNLFLLKSFKHSSESEVDRCSIICLHAPYGGSTEIF
jgi:hypothetical protein